MQYETIIKSPVRWGDEIEIPIRTVGDTIYVSISSKIDTSLKLTPNGNMSVTPKPYVALMIPYKECMGSVTEGEDITFSVVLSEARSTDTTVSVSLTHSLDMVNPEWRISDWNTHTDGFDNSMWFSLANDADFGVLSLDVVIPAGQTQATGTIPTIDDGILTGGKGSYRVTELAITAVDSTNVMMHWEGKKACILLEDANSYPEWTQGDLELWCKLLDDGLNILHYEPIKSPDDSTVTLSFKHDMDTLLPLPESFITDDTPIDKIKLIPNMLGDQPIPLDTLDVTDLSSLPPYFTVVVNVGERNGN